MRLITFFTALISFVPLSGFGIFSPSFAFRPEGIIYPGKGVDEILIGEPRPQRLTPLIEKHLKSREITILPEPPGPVKQIRLSSPTFSVAVSLLRIKYSRTADVLRFYGKGETDLKSDSIVVKYPRQGIDFEIDRVSERIEAITVYKPVLPKFTVEQYKEHREQLQPRR